MRNYMSVVTGFKDMRELLIPYLEGPEIVELVKVSMMSDIGGQVEKALLKVSESIVLLAKAQGTASMPSVCGNCGLELTTSEEVGQNIVVPCKRCQADAVDAGSQHGLDNLNDEPEDGSSS